MAGDTKYDRFAENANSIFCALSLVRPFSGKQSLCTKYAGSFLCPQKKGHNMILQQSGCALYPNIRKPSF